MVVLLNRFTVHGATDTFEDVFALVSDYMCAQPGFVGHRLVRESGSPEVYVNIAEWTSAELLTRAVRNPAFEQFEEALATVSTSRHVLHETVLDRTAVAS